MTPAPRDPQRSQKMQKRKKESPKKELQARLSQKLMTIDNADPEIVVLEAHDN